MIQGLADQPPMTKLPGLGRWGVFLAKERIFRLASKLPAQVHRAERGGLQGLVRQDTVV